MVRRLDLLMQALANSSRGWLTQIGAKNVLALAAGEFWR